MTGLSRPARANFRSVDVSHNHNGSDGQGLLDG